VAVGWCVGALVDSSERSEGAKPPPAPPSGGGGGVFGPGRVPSLYSTMGRGRSLLGALPAPIH